MADTLTTLAASGDKNTQVRPHTDNYPTTHLPYSFFQACHRPFIP